MRIAIAADHAGFPLKQVLIAHLREGGHEVTDLGTDSEESVDYPSFCAEAARSVVSGKADRAIVLGGSGQGEQIAANKVDGARAALCNDLNLAHLAREHNDANVLAIGGRIVADEMARQIVDAFLTTPFAGGRHARRIAQLTDLEKGVL